MLKITSARVIVACPRRNFVTLKIETSDGVAGVGDATLNGRELAVASYLSDHVIPCLIGRDAPRIDATIEAAQEYIALGYKAVRLQSGVPGLASTYGVSKDRMFYEPADADLPTENLWSTSKYMRSVPELFAAARERLGP